MTTEKRIIMNFPFKVLEKLIIDTKIIVVYSCDNLSKKTKPRIWENVECFRINGGKIWTVNGMESHAYFFKETSTFVGVSRVPGDVQLISFDGTIYSLNVETGKVSFKAYGK